MFATHVQFILARFQVQEDKFAKYQAANSTFWDFTISSGPLIGLLVLNVVESLTTFATRKGLPHRRQCAPATQGSPMQAFLQ